MWALHESYDPSSKVLTLELLAPGQSPETPPGTPLPTLLGTFTDLDEAHRFIDGYLKSVAYEPGKVVRRVPGQRGWEEA